MNNIGIVYLLAIVKITIIRLFNQILHFSFFIIHYSLC